MRQVSILTMPAALLGRQPWGPQRDNFALRGWGSSSAIMQPHGEGRAKDTSRSRRTGRSLCRFATAPGFGNAPSSVEPPGSQPGCAAGVCSVALGYSWLWSCLAGGGPPSALRQADLVVLAGRLSYGGTGPCSHSSTVARDGRRRERRFAFCGRDQAGTQPWPPGASRKPCPFGRVGRPTVVQPDGH